MLAVALDNEALGVVRETLAAEAVLCTDRPVGFGDALQAVKRHTPSVIIVGFKESEEAALAFAESLGRDSATTLVALADRRNAETIISAMRVGYKEFLVLPDDAARLRATVHASAYQAAEDEEAGVVVTMLGAKGGVGTTTLLANLAAELAAIHRVVCVDADFIMGDVASVLDVTPKDTVADLLPRAARLDERMLTGSCVVHKSKVHVLAQPSDLEKVTEYAADDVYHIIRAAAKGYMFVLMDCGAQLDEATTTALQVSDVILLVTTPDVVSVRDAYRRIKHLESHGVEPDRIKLIVNRARKSAFISTPDIETNLQMKVAAQVADDPETVDKAINEGLLVRDVNRKSDVARDLSRLVALVTDDDGGSPEPEEEKKGGWFSGLFGGR